MENKKGKFYGNTKYFNIEDRKNAIKRTKTKYMLNKEWNVYIVIIIIIH